MTESSMILSPYLNLSHPVPFHSFSASDIEPIILELLDRTKADLKKIEQTEIVNFENILVALDRLGQDLEACMTVYSQLESLLGTTEIRGAMQKVQPKVSAFYATIPFSEPLPK